MGVQAVFNCGDNLDYVQGRSPAWRSAALRADEFNIDIEVLGGVRA